MLEELAGLLGGRLASSRALVEKGWMPAKCQIGLSGNTVSPQYIITCGVSGTVQFMAGMKHAKNIIAINRDPDARIFEIAHYPVLGDLYEIVPGFFFGLIAIVVVSLLTPAPESEVANEFESYKTCEE